MFERCITCSGAVFVLPAHQHACVQAAICVGSYLLPAIGVRLSFRAVHVTGDCAIIVQHNVACTSLDVLHRCLLVLLCRRIWQSVPRVVRKPLC